MERILWLLWARNDAISFLLNFHGYENDLTCCFGNFILQQTSVYGNAANYLTIGKKLSALFFLVDCLYILI